MTETMDPFEREDPKKVAESNRVHQLRMAALTVTVALIGLTIVLLNARNYFPPTFYSVISILITAMFFVLISGLYGSLIIQKLRNYSEKKKHDRLAKSNFEQFKKLVIRFKDLTENRDDNMQSVMQNIKNIPAPIPFSQINVIQPIFIKDLYNFYVKRLNKFYGTKNDLLSSAKEFENMLYLYDMLYIKEPLQQIRIIGSDSVPKQNKQSFSKARQKYINFRMDYIKFAKDANGDFKEKEELGIYGSAIYFRDYFEQPDEL